MRTNISATRKRKNQSAQVSPAPLPPVAEEGHSQPSSQSHTSASAQKRLDMDAASDNRKKQNLHPDNAFSLNPSVIKSSVSNASVSMSDVVSSATVVHGRNALLVGSALLKSHTFPADENQEDNEPHVFDGCISLDVETSVDKCLPGRHVQIKDYASMTSEEAACMRDSLGRSGHKVFGSVNFDVVLPSSTCRSHRFWKWKYVQSFLRFLQVHKLIDETTYISMPNSSLLQSEYRENLELSFKFIHDEAPELVNSEEVYNLWQLLNEDYYCLIPYTSTANTSLMQEANVYYGFLRNKYAIEDRLTSLKLKAAPGARVSVFFPRTIFRFYKFVDKYQAERSQSQWEENNCITEGRMHEMLSRFQTLFNDTVGLETRLYKSHDIPTLIASIPQWLKEYLEEQKFQPLGDGDSPKKRFFLEPKMHTDLLDVTFTIRAEYAIKKGEVIGYHGGFIRPRTADDEENTTLVTILNEKEVLDAQPVYDSLFHVNYQQSPAIKPSLTFIVNADKYYKSIWGVSMGVNGISTYKDRHDLLKYGGFLFLSKQRTRVTPPASPGQYLRILPSNCKFELRSGSETEPEARQVLVLIATQDIPKGSILIEEGIYHHHHQVINASTGDDNSIGSASDDDMSDGEAAAGGDSHAMPLVAVPVSDTVAGAVATSNEEEDVEMVPGDAADTEDPSAEGPEGGEQSPSRSTRSQSKSNSGAGEKGKESEKRGRADDETKAEDEEGNDEGEDEKEKRMEQQAFDLNLADAEELVKFYNETHNNLTEKRSPGRLETDTKDRPLNLGKSRNGMIYFIKDTYLKGDDEIGSPLLPVRLQLVPGDGNCNVMSTILACDFNSKELNQVNRPRGPYGMHLDHPRSEDLFTADGAEVKKLKDSWKALH
jgi:hypothetical protein